MENLKTFSQGFTCFETANEAQTQATEQPMANVGTQEEENMCLLPAVCFLEQNFNFATMYSVA